MASEAEEVAEDYRLALEDLNANMRFEISNLTVIARENTEHALVIAEVLEKHILKVGCPIGRWTIIAMDQGSLGILLLHGRMLTRGLDGTEQETTSAVRSGLDRQECWDTIHTIPRPQYIQDFHGSIHRGRPHYP